MAGGIIEYLAEGAWTKRLHPGWAAQSGLRAALLGRSGFVGPRTVLEGVHGLFQGFAHTTAGDYGALLDGFGETFVTESLAFKPYPCGTMTHPYIDCAKKLAARGIAAEEVIEIVCEAAEGTVHRLWEPLAAKQRPPNGYAGKFSTPYCMAAGFLRGGVGLDAFTDAAVGDPRVLALAAKVGYRIDPDNLYPREFTGHLRAMLRDGRVREEDEVGQAMLRFRRKGRVYRVITMDTPLEELEDFFRGAPAGGGERGTEADKVGGGPQDFAVVTDYARRFVLGVVTKEDLEEFVKRRP